MNVYKRAASGNIILCIINNMFKLCSNKSVYVYKIYVKPPPPLFDLPPPPPGALLMSQQLIRSMSDGEWIIHSSCVGEPEAFAKAPSVSFWY